MNRTQFLKETAGEGRLLPFYQGFIDNYVK